MTLNFQDRISERCVSDGCGGHGIHRCETCLDRICEDCVAQGKCPECSARKRCDELIERIPFGTAMPHISSAASREVERLEARITTLETERAEHMSIIAQMAGMTPEQVEAVKASLAARQKGTTDGE